MASWSILESEEEAFIPLQIPVDLFDRPFNPFKSARKKRVPILVLKTSSGLKSLRRCVQAKRYSSYRLNRPRLWFAKRYIKLSDRAKFTRMGADGLTSLKFSQFAKLNGCVPTLGQLVGVRASELKPKPLKVIDRKFHQWIEKNSPLRINKIVFGDVCSWFGCKYSVSCQTDSDLDEESKSIDFNQLRSLQELGIETGFLDFFEKQMTLDGIASLLLELCHQQTRRLSQGTAGHSLAENSTAQLLLARLIFLIKSVSPRDLISSDAIHQLLGIAL